MGSRSRGEAWKRRIAKLDGYDPDMWRTNAEPRLWLDIKSEPPMDDPSAVPTDDTVSSEPPMEDSNTEPTDDTVGNQTDSTTRQTPFFEIN